MTSKEKLSKADPVLEHIIDTIPEPQIASTKDVFFDLMSCVLEQQIHYRSTKKTFEKMLDLASISSLTPDNFYLLEERSFPFLNLSAAKRETANSVVDFWDRNPGNWFEYENGVVREKLSSIRGIGRWSIDMVLLYTLERPNVLPSDDYHLKEIMTELYGLQTDRRLRAQMIDVSEKWGNNKSLAVKYLLAWKEFRKGGVR